MTDLEFSAREPLDQRDADIMGALRTMWHEADPVPEGMTDRILFALSAAALEAEVARIVDEAATLVSVRSTYERASSVTFETASLTVMIDIDEVSPDVVDLTGWLSITQAEIELREHNRSRFTHTDVNGRFDFEGIQKGLVHLVVRPSEPGAQTVITPAIEL